MGVTNLEKFLEGGLPLLIIPAIDLKGGKVVRLIRGDFSEELVYAEDPVAVAVKWVQQGAQRERRSGASEEAERGATGQQRCLSHQGALLAGLCSAPSDLVKRTGVASASRRGARTRAARA